jgi:predicted dehydrogenase
MNVRYKVAVVGAGMIANAGHIPAWKNLIDRAEIVGVSNRNLKRAQDTAERHGINKAFDTLENMLNDTSPDIVSVCTPNVSHTNIIRTCLEAGAHVVCEKPMTTSVHDAEVLYDFAEKRGLYLIAAQSSRFKAEMQAAHRIVSSGVLGDIYYAEAASFRRRGIPKWGRFHVAGESAGGPLFDLGVHILDALNWIMGNPTPISASGATYSKFGNKDEGLVTTLADSGAPVGVYDARPFQVEEFSVEDMGVGFLRYENGLTLSLRASWAANVPDGFAKTILMGTKAGLTFNPLTVIGSTGPYQSDTRPIVPADPDIPFYGHWKLTEHVLDLLDGKVEPVILPSQVVNVLKALTALYESADAGKEIRI